LISDDDGGRGENGAEVARSECVQGAQAGVEFGRGQAAQAKEAAQKIFGGRFSLLFFLIKPGKRPRKTSPGRTSDSAILAARRFFDPAAGAVRQENLRNNWAYQRFSTSIIPASGRRFACRLRRAEWLESSALPG
jgi:hypothetical protein